MQGLGLSEVTHRYDYGLIGIYGNARGIFFILGILNRLIPIFIAPYFHIIQH